MLPEAAVHLTQTHEDRLVSTVLSVESSTVIENLGGIARKQGARELSALTYMPRTSVGRDRRRGERAARSRTVDGRTF